MLSSGVASGGACACGDAVAGPVGEGMLEELGGGAFACGGAFADGVGGGILTLGDACVGGVGGGIVELAAKLVGGHIAKVKYFHLSMRFLCFLCFLPILW